jgi:hypothetical protein
MNHEDLIARYTKGRTGLELTALLYARELSDRRARSGMAGALVALAIAVTAVVAMVWR